MFYESNDNWVNGEYNKYEEIVVGIVGILMISMIINIFYTPDKSKRIPKKNTHVQKVVTTKPDKQSKSTDQSNYNNNSSANEYNESNDKSDEDINSTDTSILEKGKEQKTIEKNKQKNDSTIDIYSNNIPGLS